MRNIRTLIGINFQQQQSYNLVNKYRAGVCYYAFKNDENAMGFNKRKLRLEIIKK